MGQFLKSLFVASCSITYICQKRKFMKSIVISAIILIISTLIFSSCGNENPQTPVTNNNDSCGSSTFQQRVMSSPFTQHGFPSTYTLGSQRFYNFFYLVDSICTDKHVNSSFTAAAINDTARPMKFSAAIEWQIFWEKVDTGRTTVSGGVRNWSASINDLGLKVPFGETAAKVYVNVYVSFLSLGTQQQDSLYLLSKLSFANMQFEYNFHKPPASTSDNMINKDNYQFISIVPEKNGTAPFYHEPMQIFKNKNMILRSAKPIMLGEMLIFPPLLAPDC